MNLYILRHGDAGPNSASAADDDARVLTDAGRIGVSQIAALARSAGLTPPTIILSSPLPRAQQTAEIAMAEWGTNAEIRSSNSLVRGDILAMMSEITNLYPEHHAVLLAGHEPSLSTLASAILSGNERSFIELDKAGLIHLSVYSCEPMRMRGYLRMYLSPSHLKGRTGA